MKAIGTMSGTSMDGVDVALIETDGEKILSLGPTGYRPYSDAERTTLRQALTDAVPLTARNQRPGALADAERLVTDAHRDLVKQFVNSFISPLLALVGGKPNFDGLVVTIHGTPFPYGAFLTQVFSFLISAAVVYFVIVLPVARLLQLFERDVEATERDCPECTRSIPIKARRCPECTAEIASASGPSPAVPSPR